MHWYCFEDSLVAEVTFDLDLESAVLKKVGRAVAGHLVHLVEPGPRKEGDHLTVGDVETGLEGAEGDLPVCGRRR